MSIRSLGKNLRHLPGQPERRLCLCSIRVFRAHLVHNRLCRPVRLRRLFRCLPRSRRFHGFLCLFRLFRDLYFHLGHCVFRSFFLHLHGIRQPFLFICFIRKNAVHFPCLSEKDFRVLYLVLCCIFRKLVLRFHRFCLPGFFRFRQGLTGSFLTPKHLLQPRGQFRLQIYGIVTAHIHGLDLDIHLIFKIRLLSGRRIVFRFRRLIRRLLHLRPLCIFRPHIFLRLICLVPVGILLAVLFHLHALCLDKIFLRHRFVKPMIINLLLGRRQRLMQHFQLHGLNDIFSFSEPENQFVTLLHTAGSQPSSMIKICQFICPFFPVIPFLQFLQDVDSLFQTNFLCLI